MGLFQKDVPGRFRAIKKNELVDNTPGTFEKKTHEGLQLLSWIKSVFVSEIYSVCFLHIPDVCMWSNASSLVYCMAKYV